MIFVTGGTGFVGRVLIRHLVEAGYPVRSLVKPSAQSPNLPKGVPVEVAVCSLNDARGLRAALKDIDVVFHLAGVEARGVHANLMEVDVRGTQALAQAAVDAGVKRIFYLSHLGADSASAYPVMKAKGVSEAYLRNSGLDYTIFRSSIVYGPQDHFTTAIGSLLAGLPYFFPVPGEGKTALQPLWVEDLATCMVWSLEDAATRNQTYPLGGSECLSLKEIIEVIMDATGMARRIISLPFTTLRGLTVLFEHAFRGFPTSAFWLDYLSVDRTCALDTLPRTFQLIPARFHQRIGYLQGQNWRRNLYRQLFKPERR